MLYGVNYKDKGGSLFYISWLAASVIYFYMLSYITGYDYFLIYAIFGWLFIFMVFSVFHEHKKKIIPKTYSYKIKTKNNMTYYSSPIRKITREDDLGFWLGDQVYYDKRDLVSFEIVED